MAYKLEPLIIGDLEIEIPIIQGGMGVKVSTAPLVAAVANQGCAGTIAGVGLGYGSPDNNTDFIGASNRGLIQEIRKTKELTRGIFGVNIMHALSNYKELVETAVTQQVHFIASGAGLPKDLPGLVKNICDEYGIAKMPKLFPIVSSKKVTDFFIRIWLKNFGKPPDAIVVEGPKAGGHLGFNYHDLVADAVQSLEDIVKDVIAVVKSYQLDIPVIAAGGIFSGKDIARFIEIGAKGFQIATRFVATCECSVAKGFKDMYLAATEKDLRIIKSPVSMPGRAINNPFVEAVQRGEEIPYNCGWQCLKSCNPNTAPFCIAEAMFNASIGDIQNGLFFAGANVGRIHKIVPVRDLIGELVEETKNYLNK